MDSFIDVDVVEKRRTKISDVMTVHMAIKSSKSSKNHKMKPRSVKRDQTKTRDAKDKTRDRLAQRA